MTFSNAELLSGKIIVIDPGHAAKNSNGKIVNYGCKSASGVKETDIVVDISEILGALFLQEGATTYFTRDRKNYWRPAESQDADNQSRAEFANSKNADLFLRIHCNWSPKAKKRGISVLWYKDDSKKFAETVYEETKKSGVTVDGIHKQHLVGFEFAKVPSILIEYGYLSNKEDEKLLKDKKYLQKVSDAVVEGLKKYFSETENAENFSK
ncbi:MAG: N-acetylmuramoyl-L-alanine amidase [Elusimicrobiota bacterium]|nr:N-acetylmuramoyl-L-alanine amidase [Elusimicrobiota bacterium]